MQFFTFIGYLCFASAAGWVGCVSVETFRNERYYLLCRMLLFACLSIFGGLNGGGNNRTAAFNQFVNSIFSTFLFNCFYLRFRWYFRLQHHLGFRWRLRLQWHLKNNFIGWWPRCASHHSRPFKRDRSQWHAPSCIFRALVGLPVRISNIMRCNIE